VQTAFDKSPLSGNVFIFRGRRADLIKILWHDSEGMCLLIRLLPAATEVAGWDSHPLKDRALARRTRNPTLSATCR
jgi:hypothetical protein